MYGQATDTTIEQVEKELDELDSKLPCLAPNNAFVITKHYINGKVIVMPVAPISRNDADVIIINDGGEFDNLLFKPFNRNDNCYYEVTSIIIS